MAKKVKINFKTKHVLAVAGPLVVALVGFAVVPKFSTLNYKAADPTGNILTNIEVTETIPAQEEVIQAPPKVEATHIKMPAQVKALYMTSYAAGTKSFRDRILKLLDETELNSVVIDIKDYTGKIAFEVADPALQETGAVEKRIPDIVEFINLLHSKNVYVIGRISVFQDTHMVKTRPDLAVKKASDKNAVWKDRKGISWIDAGSKEFWDYIIALGKESYNVGFDELNFDYIRFPSDGNMKDIYYPFSEGRIKADALEEFFKYLNENLKFTKAADGALTPTEVIISADLFGMTMTNTDDLNIGQVLEKAAPYFDYIAPMVYPSHWPSGWNSFKNPAAVPYEVIKISMAKGVERLQAMGENPLKLRPWLQDFDLGANYTPELVRAQIKATYDVGLTSWMLWDPKNLYTHDALENNPEAAN